MRKLFLTIFLSISFAVMAAFVVGMAITSWARPAIFARSVAPDVSDRGENRGTRKSEHGWRYDHLASYSRTVAWVLAHNGPTAAAEYAATLDSSRTNGYLLDQQGHEVGGRSVPPNIQAIHAQALISNEFQVVAHEGVFVTGLKMKGPDDTEFVFAAATQSRESQLAAYRLWKFLLTLAPVIATLVVVCYLVAGYVSNPVLKLRQAVQQFAGGDLEHRVDASVGRRKDELGELARDFDHMATRLAGLITGQRRLLQDISHELRSPLARQAVAIELARRGPGPEFEDAIERTAREGVRINELVGELLTLARLEDTGGAIERSSVNLDKIVQEIVKDANFEAQSRCCSVRLDAASPCTVDGVPELLRRAVENVVRNAIVHAPPETSIDVSLSVDETHVIVSVSDHGQGVPEAELANIFRPFHRVSRGRERLTGGVGLGLAITERVAASHGGNVTASNAPDGGLIVKISLQRHLAPDRETPHRNPKQTEPIALERKGAVP